MKPLVVVSALGLFGGWLAAAPAEPATWMAIAGALGGAFGVWAKSHYDARKAERRGETQEVQTLVKALVAQSDRVEKAQGRLIEKLLTDQAHQVARLDEMSGEVRQSREAHHKCELTCADLTGRLALLERDRDISRTATAVSPAVVVVEQKPGAE